MEHCPVSADFGEKLGQASFGGLGKLLPSDFSSGTYCRHRLSPRKISVLRPEMQESLRNARLQTRQTPEQAGQVVKSAKTRTHKIRQAAGF